MLCGRYSSDSGGGETLEKAIDRVEILANTIARKIRWMGLQVAAEKSEAVRFRRRGEKRIEENLAIMIEDTRISIKHNMKYLGILVRDDWSIRDHLERIATKAEITVNKLNRLMVNMKGPSEKKRKLY